MKRITSILATLLALIGTAQNCNFKIHIPCITFCAAGTFQVDSGMCSSTAIYVTGGSHSYAWQCSDGSQGTGTITTYVPGAAGVTSYTFYAICDDPGGAQMVTAIGSVTAVNCPLGWPDAVGIQEQNADRVKPMYLDLYGNRVKDPRPGTILVEQRGQQHRKVLQID